MISRKRFVYTEEAQLSSEEAQLSKDSSRFSSYEAYELPNYGVSASVRVVYHASLNQVEIAQKFVVYIDLKAEKYSRNLSSDRLETKYESCEISKCLIHSPRSISELPSQS